MAGNSDFDLVIGKWSFGLVEEVNELFLSSGRQNMFGYSNAEVDAVSPIRRFGHRHRTARCVPQVAQVAQSGLALFVPVEAGHQECLANGEVSRNIVAPYYYFTEIDSWSVDG